MQVCVKICAVGSKLALQKRISVATHRCVDSDVMQDVSIWICI